MKDGDSNTKHLHKFCTTWYGEDLTLIHFSHCFIYCISNGAGFLSEQYHKDACFDSVTSSSDEHKPCGCTVCPISYYFLFRGVFKSNTKNLYHYHPRQSNISIQVWFHCMICFFDDEVVVGEPTSVWDVFRWRSFTSGTRYSPVVLPTSSSSSFGWFPWPG